MNLTLKNNEFIEEGIFGEIWPDDESYLLATLQRAYACVGPDKLANGLWAPKIPNGIYNCVRGLHQLHGSSTPFVTFEITGVQGHSGLLFHPGNVELDSVGCILLGLHRLEYMIQHSKDAFKIFMDAQNDINQFKLTVI